MISFRMGANTLLTDIGFRMRSLRSYDRTKLNPVQNNRRYYNRENPPKDKYLLQKYAFPVDSIMSIIANVLRKAVVHLSDQLSMLSIVGDII